MSLAVTVDLCFPGKNETFLIIKVECTVGTFLACIVIRPVHKAINQLSSQSIVSTLFWSKPYTFNSAR